MSMFSGNNANVSMNSVKSLEMADVCANGSYQSHLSTVLRQKRHPPVGFKKTFLRASLDSPKILQLLKNTPSFLTASTTRKKSPPVYFFHPTEHNRVLDA